MLRPSVALLFTPRWYGWVGLKGNFIPIHSMEWPFNIFSGRIQTISGRIRPDPDDFRPKKGHFIPIHNMEWPFNLFSGRIRPILAGSGRNPAGSGRNPAGSGRFPDD